jgi:eukaryotic-like serine/threonine-protein kinase
MLVDATPDSTLRATVKILDIGLGRTLFEEGMSGEPGDVALTTEGVLLGTPDYMSPEQARDPRHSDIRADIYSLGCVLYHLLAGQPPFPDTNIISQMIRHATEPAKPLKTFNPAVPDGLQQIVNWMMAKDAAQRYPTPERAAGALQVFLVAGNEQLAAPESDPRMRPYLTWLEVESGKQPIVSAAAKPPSGTLPSAVKPPSGTPPAVKPPSGPPPAAKLSKPPKLPKQAQAAGQQEHLRTGKRLKKKHRSPSAPAAELAAQIDVELVPFDLPDATAKKSVERFRLTRRDALVFGVGALMGAVVTFIGALIAFLGRRE